MVAQKGRIIFISSGDGSVTRDYVYIGDVAEAFANALNYRGSESVFNMGSGEGTSLSELLTRIESVLRQPVARTHLRGRATDVRENFLSNELARRELGWTPVSSLDEDSIGQRWMRSELGGKRD